MNIDLSVVPTWAWFITSLVSYWGAGVLIARYFNRTYEDGFDKDIILILGGVFWPVALPVLWTSRLVTWERKDKQSSDVRRLG